MPARPTTATRSAVDRWARGVPVSVGDRRVVVLAPEAGRVRLGLVLPGVDRAVDVTVQPGVATRALLDSALAEGMPVGSVAAGAHRAIADAAERAGAPGQDRDAPEVERALLAALGGIAFPLLSATYDLGGSPLGEVPRWATPVLAAPTIGDGARAGFGDAATRIVRRALVATLAPLPGGEVDLAGLALGLLGRSAMPADRLARVLAADRVPQPAADLPDPTTVARAASTLRSWGPRRCERVLVEAAGRRDGVAMVLATVRYAKDLDVDRPRTLPNRLEDLHDAHRCLVRSAPRAVPPTRRARAPRREEPLHQVLMPPERLAPVAASAPLAVSDRLAALDGLTVDGLTFLVPRTAGDLERWGRLLSNCLATFGPAGAAGRASIVGVSVRGALTYAVELTPSGTVRQFNGPANRPVPMADRVTVLSTLADGGIIDPDAPDNLRWVRPAPDASGGGAPRRR